MKEAVIVILVPDMENEESNMKATFPRAILSQVVEQVIMKSEKDITYRYVLQKQEANS